MKHLIAALFGAFFVLALPAQQVVKVSHAKWTELLQKYVDPYGMVDYEGFKEDEAELDAYLKLLSEHHPEPYWKVDEQKAYWINAYNAFTVKLILEHYPLESIQQIEVDGKKAWSIPFITIEKKIYTLDYIEKTMLLGQFNDSRIHFVLNCSATSCPILRNKAYSSNNLNIELRLAARRYINDDRFNILNKNHVQISQLFSWYKDDFLVDHPSIQAYLDAYTQHLDIDDNASISYMNYNWGLNEQK